MLQSIPALVRALSDDDWEVARNAASALEELRLDPDLAVPELIKCLGHSDERARLEAMDALGGYGTAAQAAVPALTRIAETDSRSLEGSYAGNALKKIVPGTRP
jgi:HEAT repeat protein